MKRLHFPDLIAYEDQDYLFINKPPYQAALHERQPGNAPLSLLEMGRDYHPDLSPCHRLDKETSGVMAFAKHQEAYRHMAIQFQEREVTKVYHAVVEGVQDFEDTAVMLPLYARRNGTAMIDKGRGKEAITIYKTLQPFTHHTLVACMPITGRMHQIRIHLAYLQAPIVMDETYGGRPLYLSQIKRHFNLKKGQEEKPLIQRVALHAKYLRYTGLDGKENTVEVDYPKDIRALLNQLEKWD